MTPEQQALAAAHVPLANRIAARYSRQVPREADSILSAALWGLCLAARNFDPTRGVAFTSFAGRRIVGGILDAAREALPKGCRRNQHRGSVRISSLTAAVVEDVEGEDLIAADTLAVGWELDSQDSVEHLAASLPPKYARALRAAYLRCDCTRLAGVAALLDVSDSRVSQMLTTALGLLRETHA